MNEHLQPVFGILLPELEKVGIEYWVYGGVGIAAVVGRFLRYNTDVDIFIEQSEFVRATACLDNACRHDGLKPHLIPGRRPKFEVKVRETDRSDILSIVPAYRKDGYVEFIFKPRPAQYPEQILTRVPRCIRDHSFFSPPDGYIRELFKTYLTNRPEKKRSKKVQVDARAIFGPDELRELIGEGE
jgi:hypothetical protein